LTALRVHRYVAAGLIVIAAGLALAMPSAVRAEQVPQPIALTLGDYAFSPAQIEVVADRPVVLTLTNTDAITPHNFTLQDTDAGLDIDTDVGAGTSVVIEFTPRAAGSYRFYCNKKLPFMKSHQARGMEGTLTVKSASPD